MEKQQHGSIAVVMDSDAVLLQKREDFRIWALPGGGVEAGETYETAAIRETREETGLIVEVAEHVANIHRPQLGDIQHIYLYQMVGGEIVKQSSETVDVGWFSIDELPNNCSKATTKYISIALSHNNQIVEETIQYSRWFLVIRKIAFTLRDFRNRFRG